MKDAITAIEARKCAVDAAQSALQSGARSELRIALDELPHEGSEADGLRNRIELALAGFERGARPSSDVDSEVASCVSDGLTYEFRCAATGDIAFFSVDRDGSYVRVTINSAHPFGRKVEEESSLENPTVLALLAAWAHHELEQSDKVRMEQLRNARVDWGRVIRRLLSVDGYFQTK